MKAIPFKIPKDKYSSIKVQVDQGMHFYDKLHYHPEVQITAIIKGRGIVYGGNNMVNFKEGDVFVFGGNIPHLVKNSSIYFSDDSPGVLSNTLFFDRETFGGGFLKMKEMANVNYMLTKAQRGIQINSSSIANDVVNAIDQVDEILVQSLINILISIVHTDKRYINNEYYTLSLEEGVGERLNNILAFTFTNMNRKISIVEVAAVANLSISQFSRYFKTHTGKSYVQFLNELRIETACNLLIENTYTVTQICFQVGFQNVSNFNRKFKELKNCSPRQYRNIQTEFRGEI